MLIVGDPWYSIPESLSEQCEERFTDQELDKLELPQQCVVKIAVREYVWWPQGDPPRPEQVPDKFMEWVKNVERRVKV